MDFQIALKIRAKNGILQKFIDEKGWTQSDFARALNIGNPNGIAVVSGWFNMKTTPAHKYIRKIEKLTGFLIEEIFPQILKKIDFKKRVSCPVVIYKNVKEDILPFTEMQKISYTPDFDKFELIENITSTLGTLSPREEKIIRMRFGINEDKESCLEDVGKHFGISRMRVQQIEAKALRKLRHESNRDKLKDFF